ncbi:adenylate kinase family protein [Candidatus Micrarchaeota archaeon]|nr:adenylate kinase family protein [Candidatus Micrarchaeota archaeon]
MRIIITGTPGTGKTAIAKMLGKELGCTVLHVNDILKGKKLYSKIINGEYVANFGGLKKYLKKSLEDKNIILESHLLCEMDLPADLVIVLRCSPQEIEKRLLKRKYPLEKVRENGLSELLDYCQIKAISNYGNKVMQIDATRKIGTAKIMAEIRRFNLGKTPNIRWLAKISQKELEKYF